MSSENKKIILTQYALCCATNIFFPHNPQTNDELSVTVDRCAKVETKSEEAYTKADVERIHLQDEVEQVRLELGNISQELSEEKMLFNSYIHQCNDLRQQFEDNEQELMVLEVKHENAKTAEEMQAAKVRPSIKAASSWKSLFSFTFKSRLQ